MGTGLQSAYKYPPANKQYNITKKKAVLSQGTAVQCEALVQKACT